MKLAASLMMALCLMMGFAAGGEMQITIRGRVTANAYTTGPFSGGSIGDTAVLSFRVTTPGVDVVGGQLTNYAIDPSTFSLDVNGATGAMLATPTNLQVQNDFPSTDGLQINQTVLASGHFFECGFSTDPTFFPSTDVEMLTGNYDIGASLISAVYSVLGQGGSMEILPLLLTIEVPSSGVQFCSPMDPNSTGLPTGLVGVMGTGSGSGLHLEAFSGPPQQFGYFLVGTGVLDPGIVISDGRLCLSGAAGNAFGRYNLVGGDLNSVGQFDSTGVMQNIVGTSAVGTGFDVPQVLPLTLSPQIAAGETWHFQLWHRDGSGASNFSNGLSVTF